MRRKPMQVTIETIVKANGHTVEQFYEGIKNLDFYLKIQMPGYMPLVIEATPEGMISVMHYYIQNHDIMRDPEVVFDPRTWHGVEMTQDNMGFYQRVPAGMYSPGLESFNNMWAKNLRHQGFTERRRS